MSTDESEYFRTRAIEERARAAHCGDQSIANIHLDLAEKYKALAPGQSDALCQIGGDFERLADTLQQRIDSLGADEPRNGYGEGLQRALQAAKRGAALANGKNANLG